MGRPPRQKAPLERARRLPERKTSPKGNPGTPRSAFSDLTTPRKGFSGAGPAPFRSANQTKSNGQLCYVRCSDVGPQPDQKVTISYAMFDFSTDSVDFRCPPRSNVDHNRMTCEARPTCEVDRLAWSEQLSDLSTVAVLRGNAFGSAGPSAKDGARRV